MNTANEAQSQDLMERIKKLLALSKSSNPNEAAAALSRAQKLMKEHDISAGDLDMSAIDEQTVKPLAGMGAKKVALALFGIITKAFGLSGFSTQRSSKVLSYTLIGPKDRLETALYATDIVMRQAAIVRKEFMAKFARENAHMKKNYHTLSMSPEEVALAKLQKPGFYELMKTLQDIINDSKQHACVSEYNRALRRQTELYIRGWLVSVNDKITAFAISDHENRLIEDYTNKHHPDLTITHSRPTYFSDEEWEAFNKGKRDGRDGFSLFRGVKGMESAKLEDLSN